MKKTSLRLLAIFSITIFCTQCSTTQKRSSSGDYQTDSLENPANASSGNFESIYDQPLPDPRGTINPSEVDYQKLKNLTIYFDYDSFSIRSGERSKLEEVAQMLTSSPSAKLMLAGHTDERGTVQYNLGLGERRALATRDYLLGLGVSGDRIATISYGEEKPAISGSGESIWSKNRRCDLGWIAK